MYKMYVLLMAIFVGTTSLLSTNIDSLNKDFVKKVYQDYCNSLQQDYRNDLQNVVKNTPFEICDSAVNLINSMHKLANRTRDTIYICDNDNEGSCLGYSIIYQGEILFFKLGKCLIENRYHGVFCNISSIPITEYYSSFYISLLTNWRTDILETNYVREHFIWALSSGYCITRLIYKKGRLKRTDRICHDEFDEMYKQQ